MIKKRIYKINIPEQPRIEDFYLGDEIFQEEFKLATEAWKEVCIVIAKAQEELLMNAQFPKETE
jgi:hypothetical protein